VAPLLRYRAKAARTATLSLIVASVNITVPVLAL